jgi:hypothetical protein
VSKKEYSRHEIEVSKSHDCGAEVEFAIRCWGDGGFLADTRVTIPKELKCRISGKLYAVNCKEGPMVALLLSLLTYR